MFITLLSLLNYISHARDSISIPCCPWPARCGGVLFLRPGSVLAGFSASLWGLLLGVYRAHRKTRRPTNTAKAMVPRRIAHQYSLTVSLRPVKKTTIKSSKFLGTFHCWESSLSVELVFYTKQHDQKLCQLWCDILLCLILTICYDCLINPSTKPLSNWYIRNIFLSKTSYTFHSLKWSPNLFFPL